MYFAEQVLKFTWYVKRDLDSIPRYTKLALNVHLTWALCLKYVLIVLPSDYIDFWKSENHNILILFVLNHYYYPTGLQS